MTCFNRREFSALALAIGTSSPPLAQAASRGTIDEVLKSGITQRKIPAAAAMVASDKETLYSGAFGTRDTSGVAVNTDSIFAIASMTKAITTVAALQLVEQRKVTLDVPLLKYLPKLADLKVLDGFDAQSGKPQLRPSKTPVTLKHCLTHTCGFCYDNWDGSMFRYVSSNGGKVPDGIVGPLMFEPGTRWQYGTGVDWAGRLVEAISGLSLEEYFQTHILRPLKMLDTSYILPENKFERLVSRSQRLDDGSVKQAARAMPAPPKEFNGGGGLYSTVGDYTKFMQMILTKGRGADGSQILSAPTVASMEMNQIGSLSAGKMKSFHSNISSDVDIQPGAEEKWGLGFLINPTPYKGGRSAGSLAWAGLYNTFYWIDPKRSLCAVLMMQFLPFVDREATGLLEDFERAVYKNS